MKVLKVRSIGNSLGVILPSSELDNLNINKDTELTMTTHGQSTILRKMTLGEKGLIARAKRLLKEYDVVLSELND